MKIKKTLNLPILSKKLTELGLNQASIARELDISRETVSKWFKSVNQPSAGKLLKLSKLLKLEFEDILILEYLDQPIVDYRKNATAKTSEKDKEFAVGMGNAIERLLPYFQLDITTKPPVLLNPQNDYDYISEVAQKIRTDMKFTNDILMVKDIISIFNKYHSVIIPVLWGVNKRHANALRIYLPDSMTTWIYLNLNTKMYDFKFWMSHELGHVLAFDLKEKEAESFADNFAGALLFPRQQAEDLYNKLINENSKRQQIDMIIEKGKEFVISPLSVYLQIGAYAKHYNKPDINLKHLIYKFNTKFNSYFPTVAMKIFKNEHPKAERYINYVNEKFKPPFFTYLNKYIEDKSPSPVFIQNLLDVSFLDAQNIYHAL